jgi:hypothetical protein
MSDVSIHHKGRLAHERRRGHTQELADRQRMPPKPPPPTYRTTERF